MVKNGRFYHDFSQEETGKKIAEIIQKSGYTDRELAESLMVSVQAVNKWRHGKSLPDIVNLASLAQIFHVKIEDFLACRKLTEKELFSQGHLLSKECELQRIEKDYCEYERPIMFRVG